MGSDSIAHEAQGNKLREQVEMPYFFLPDVWRQQQQHHECFEFQSDAIIPKWGHHKFGQTIGRVPYHMGVALGISVWIIFNSCIHIRGRETRQTGYRSDEFPVLVWIRDENIIWLTDMISH